MPPPSAECCARCMAALMKGVGAFSAGTVARLHGKREHTAGAAASIFITCLVLY